MSIWRTIMSKIGAYVIEKEEEQALSGNFTDFLAPEAELPQTFKRDFAEKHWSDDLDKAMASDKPPFEDK